MKEKELVVLVDLDEEEALARASPAMLRTVAERPSGGTELTDEVDVSFGEELEMRPDGSIVARARPEVATVDVRVISRAPSDADSADRFTYTEPFAPTVTSLRGTTGAMRQPEDGLAAWLAGKSEEEWQRMLLELPVAVLRLLGAAKPEPGKEAMP